MRINFELNWSKQKLNRVAIIFLLILFFGLVLNCGFTLFPSWDLQSKYVAAIDIQRGMSPDEIAELLHKHQIIQSKNSFLWAAKLLGVSRHLQAGRYEFSGRINNFSILKKIAAGKVITEQITFPEGIKAIEVASILQEKLRIDSVEFVNLVNDPEFVRSLGIQADRLEGYLFPDTYQFYTDASPAEVVQRMVYQWKQEFNDSLIARTRQMQLTVHEILTLASIVEGEAVLDSERPIVAAIYINRLHRGMPLQACPTVQYLLPEGPRRLLKKDLEIDSPYNTYRNVGLPPGPVNNPGMKSILAVLNPAPVNYLYLVANGDGTHTFSRTMNEHLEAKKRFDRIRRYYRQ
ncbi:endolytic transglycosylase MltG [bacterium]|nr:endolytic transglycosylase MltG [bacterium]